mmetsp:Transcript_96146/g.255455  ORF Transcript_96146/g.255455 Transcript_96146/m.255455 type:complete len:271 (+) Transcript_96146:199-1011(+)
MRYQKSVGRMNDTRKATVLPRMDQTTRMLRRKQLTKRALTRRSTVSTQVWRREGSAALCCTVSSLGANMSQASNTVPRDKYPRASSRRYTWTLALLLAVVEIDPLPVDCCCSSHASALWERRGDPNGCILCSLGSLAEVSTQVPCVSSAPGAAWGRSSCPSSPWLWPLQQGNALSTRKSAFLHGWQMRGKLSISTNPNAPRPTATSLSDALKLRRMFPQVHRPAKRKPKIPTARYKTEANAMVRITTRRMRNWVGRCSSWCVGKALKWQR